MNKEILEPVNKENGNAYGDCREREKKRFMKFAGR